ncbi:GMC family oxidoreductase [Acetobacter sp. TBRC 12305]|uniref:GMC family oxidoreductase n=1 Tax=Acetobacter garciniae TaxID=2817435 RepID=A0A939HJU9_9PROT|nr:GMC family oxidoreductase [Acetobacter garciniae]MBO1325760.1 GMC family oxidoreductase [Acetobacter garciniae]MBX0345660.1 GMC family oxidoreductase [Acetobacter garciniae]
MAQDTQTADVVIVGAGICGSMLAHKLARNGLSVILLDAGPHRDRDQIVENWRNMPPHNKSEYDYATPYPSVPWAPHTNYFPDNGYLIVKGPDASAYRQGIIKGVGGTTWHWAGSSWRYLPNDFRLKSTYGVGRDYAVSYDEIEPYYYAAELEMGVKGPNGQEIIPSAPRKNPWPMDSMPFGPGDRLFTDIVKPMGYDNTPVPQARNSRPYDGRPQCVGNNNCMPICPIGAMYHGVYGAWKAERHGAKIIANAVVYSIETDGKNNIVAMNYYDPDKGSHRVVARTFVIAANGIETPKLLLLAANDRNPNGIANSSDQVGRNMMDHPGIGMSFQSAEPVWAGGGSVQMSSITNFRDGDFRSEYAAIQIGYNNTAQNSRAGMKALSMGLVGKKLDDEIRRRTAHGVDIYANHEVLPHPDNRLVLSKEHKDALGIPHPEVTYDVGEYVRKSAVLSRQHLMKIAKAMGGTEIEMSSFFTPNNHITGGTMMGHDPKDSVVDSWLRTHDHPNLFLATGGAMAASGTVNSTLTMAALSLRAGDAILGDLKHG